MGRKRKSKKSKDDEAAAAAAAAVVVVVEDLPRVCVGVDCRGALWPYGGGRALCAGA
jgi:hypothetical protein